MKVQKLFKEVSADLRQVEPFSDWQELSPEFEVLQIEDCLLVIAHIKDEDFDRLTDIFQSRQDAMGAFLSVALEHGWEEVPRTYCVYHAEEVDGRLIAGIKVGQEIGFYEQRTVEQMAQLMARVHRIVVYSYEVVTFVKDVYPDIDSKVFVIARQIAKKLGKAPELEELARIYGMRAESLEDKLKLIEKLLENPVRTPYGEVELPPFSYPLAECE